MKVRVAFLNDERTKARITIVPGWIARLFGALPREGDADRLIVNRWRWTTTNRDIRDDPNGSAILRELETQTVVPILLAMARAHKASVSK